MMVTIFDLDGVIADNLQFEQEVTSYIIAHIAEVRGLDLGPATKIWNDVLDGNREHPRWNDYAVHCDALGLGDAWKEAHRAAAAFLCPTPNLEQILAAAKALGPCWIASDATTWVVEFKLARLGLLAEFAEVFTLDRCRANKGDPHYWRVVGDRLPYRGSGVVYIDNRLDRLQAALQSIPLCRGLFVSAPDDAVSRGLGSAVPRDHDEGIVRASYDDIPRILNSLQPPTVQVLPTSALAPGPPPAITDQGVFAAELDDDARSFVGPDAGKRAILAYMLLGKRIVVHPAYVWQDENTNALLLSDAREILKPPKVSIVLGDSPNVRDYMNDRIARLRESAERYAEENVELEQYLGYERCLGYEAEALDSLFSKDGGHYPLVWSRDRKFRECVRNELLNDDRCGDHLYAILFRTRGHILEIQFRDVVRALVDLTDNNALLCSVDSIIGELVDHGFSRARLDAAFNRLHLLHWEANSGSNLHVPLLERVKSRTLDPFDPEAFWTGVEELIGEPPIQQLVRLDWYDACRIAEELHSDGTWAEFIDTYKYVVKCVEHECATVDVEAICQKLASKFPTKTRVFWMLGGRMAILSAVCSTLSYAVGGIGFGGPLGGAVATLGLIGFGATIRGTISAWRQAASQYAQSPRSDLGVRIRSAIRRLEMEK